MLGDRGEGELGERCELSGEHVQESDAVGETEEYVWELLHVEILGLERIHYRRSVRITIDEINLRIAETGQVDLVLIVNDHPLYCETRRDEEEPSFLKLDGKPEVLLYIFSVEL